MVPIYALVSWLSLRFISARRWLSPLRECYESVALYSFLRYLIECLQIRTGDYEAWLEALPPQEPMWPLRGLLGRVFGVHTIEHGADFMHAMRRVRLVHFPLHDTFQAALPPHGCWCVQVLRYSKLLSAFMTMWTDVCSARQLHASNVCVCVTT
jgi:hypothetical protein